MKKLLPIFIMFFLLLSNLTVAQIMVGVGGGYIITPKNPDISPPVVPNGESCGMPFFILTGAPASGLGVGASMCGYNYEARTISSDRLNSISIEWVVPHYNVFLVYRVPLQTEINDSFLGIRVGLTVSPIKVINELKYRYEPKTFSDYIFPQYNTTQSHDNELKAGPYIGADIIMPIQHSNFSIFLKAEKSFIEYERENDNINLGAFIIGGGVAYTFSLDKFK